ncbi:MAG: sigma-54 dependent transcriptional regulator [Candidatus Competibacteraceae bacterium]|nr:sigma-54 dependent transcriptional regulator [Candidatus Competibacteraceae bacterium]
MEASGKIGLVYQTPGPVLRQLHTYLQELDYSVELLRIKPDGALPDPDNPRGAIVRFIGESATTIHPLAGEIHPDTPVLAVLSRMPPTDILVDCQDFLLWPCPPEELRIRLARLMGSRGTGQMEDGTFARANLIGHSPAFQTCLKMIRKLARWSVPVLIQGETGTGKELAARALHYLGPRRGKPFIPLNCGAVPDTLLANELFGHERGAFTDARSAHRGLIAQAEGGTLFLDEVDCLSPANQIILLRFLQDHCYRPLGGPGTMKANLAVIAATNADLRRRVQEKAFREDLLYRLGVTELVMPSLRQRRDDIQLLARHFLDQYCSRYGQVPKRLSQSSLRWLEGQNWPGNVRELENTIHRELLLAEGLVVHIDPQDRPDQPPAAAVEDFSFAEDFNRLRARWVADFERRYLEQLMEATGGNVSRAARLAGKERRQLGKLLQKHGIRREDYLSGAVATTNPPSGSR